MEQNLPKCKLIGKNGNAFNLIGLTRRALLNAGLADKAKEFAEKAYKQASYDDVLNLISEYVDVY
jgi:hypothetical protein